MKNNKEKTDKILKTTMENLNKNGIDTYYASTKKEVIKLLEELMKNIKTVAAGGSMTLFECDIIDFLRSEDFEFHDRYAPGLSGREIEEIYKKSYYADAYLCSANAITQKGQIYNVDGRSNRVSAIAFGPENVFMVVSTEKIVKDLDEAVKRVKTIAAPKNCVRLECDTYCRKNNKCVSLLKDSPDMTEGCDSPDRICCNYLVTDMQRQKGRIKVIFVGEPCGY